MNGKIYLLTFPNGKCYIGQTIRTVRQRMHEHRCHGKGLVPFAFKKHGEPEVTILAEGITDQVQLDRIEVLLIAGMGTMAPSGYNLAEGGRGGEVHVEVRAKMSEIMRGNTNALGFKHGPEFGEEVAKRNRGNTYKTGYRMTDAQRQTVSTRMVGNINGRGNRSRTGQKQSAEEIAKRSEALRGKKRTPEQRERYRQAAIKREAAKKAA